MVKRSLDFLTVDGAAGFYKFALLDIGSDAQLPVCTGFALGNDVLSIFAVGNDLAGNLKGVILDAGGDDAHTGISFVFVIGQQGDCIRNFHSGKIHHDRVLPPR